MSDGIKAAVSGKAGNDDLKATNDPDGTLLSGGAGDDILRGGKYDDIIVGGAGNDLMFGGGGADQFRFFGSQIDGASDYDRVFDLNFGEGDSLVFGDYGSGFFTVDDNVNVNSFAGGASASVHSWEGLVALAGSSTEITATQARGVNVLLTLDFGGQTQEIEISNGWAAFTAAGGSEGL